MSRLLVVDASVVRSAGGADATVPVSTRCRDCLKAILEVCHRVLLTQAVLAEWKRHASRFARIWQRQMHARRKFADESDVDVRDTVTAAHVEKAIADAAHQAAAEKDRHLVNAALAGDKIILTRDDAACCLFARLKQCTELYWANPGTSEDGLVAWLEGGAQPER